jgi:hypothetical protein
MSHRQPQKKRCSRCKQHKDLTQFNKNSNGRGDGLQSWCKPCKANAAKLARAALRPEPVKRPRGWNLWLVRPEKLDMRDARLIRQLGGISASKVAHKFGVSASLIRAIRRGERWREVAR